MDRLARGCAGASAVAAVTVLPRTARVRGGGASAVTAAAASTLVDRFFLPLFMVGVCMNAHKTIVNKEHRYRYRYRSDVDLDTHCVKVLGSGFIRRQRAK